MLYLTQYGTEVGSTIYSEITDDDSQSFALVKENGETDSIWDGWYLLSKRAENKFLGEIREVKSYDEQMKDRFQGLVTFNKEFNSAH